MSLSNPSSTNITSCWATLLVDLECIERDHVYFYDNEDTLIGIDGFVENGQQASINWLGVVGGKEYQWYAKTDDWVGSNTTDLQSFTTPENQYYIPEGLQLITSRIKTLPDEYVEGIFDIDHTIAIETPLDTFQCSVEIVRDLVEDNLPGGNSIAQTIHSESVTEGSFCTIPAGALVENIIIKPDESVDTNEFTIGTSVGLADVLYLPQILHGSTPVSADEIDGMYSFTEETELYVDADNIGDVDIDVYVIFRQIT